MRAATFDLCRVAAASLVIALLADSLAGGAADAARHGFARVNRLHLHYNDWGGTGAPILFLPGLGDSVDSFDSLATRFTDRFHVWGLTRRGQGQSDKPTSGYDPRILAADIRSFMDAVGVQRATLIGFSVAGNEMTQFATLYPDRVDRLVYLDAADDYKSGYELATNPRTRYPLPLPDPPGPLGEIVRAARVSDSDYTKVSAPALALLVVHDGAPIPADAAPELRARLVKRWEDYGKPFQQQRLDHFVRDMRN